MTSTSGYMTSTSDYISGQSSDGLKSVGRWAALFIVIQIVLFALTLIVGGAAINWPAGEDRPLNQFLPLISQQKTGVVVAFYAYILSAAAAIPTVFLLHRLLKGTSDQLLTIATAFGVISAVFRIIGVARWIVVAPFLSQLYTAPSTSEGQRQTIATIYSSIDKFAGTTFGENLGDGLFNLVWTALIGIAIIRTIGLRRIPRWLGWAGIVVAALLLVSLGSVLDIDTGPISTAAVITIWQVWLLALAIFLVIPNRRALKA